MKKALLMSLCLATSLNIHAQDVLFTVDGINVTNDDANAATVVYGVDFSKLSPEQKELFWNRIAEHKVFYKEAQKAGITNEHEYKQIVQFQAEEFAGDAWFNREVQKTKASDKEIKEFYNKNKTQFVENGKQLTLKDENLKKYIENIVKQEKVRKKYLEKIKIDVVKK